MRSQRIPTCDIYCNFCDLFSLLHHHWIRRKSSTKSQKILAVNLTDRPCACEVQRMLSLVRLVVALSRVRAVASSLSLSLSLLPCVVWWAAYTRMASRCALSEGHPSALLWKERHTTPARAACQRAAQSARITTVCFACVVRCS